MITVSNFTVMVLLYPNLQDDQVTFILILFALLFEVWPSSLFLISIARSHLEYLDVIQYWTSIICHNTFPSLELCWYATVVEITCQLLDGEGCGDLQSMTYFVLVALKLSLGIFSPLDPAQACRLYNLIYHV